MKCLLTIRKVSLVVEERAGQRFLVINVEGVQPQRFELEADDEPSAPKKTAPKKAAKKPRK